MLYKIKSNIHYLYLAVLSFFLLPFFQLIFYSHPAVDDFAIAEGARRFGVLENVYRLYIGWFGRYTASFFVSFEKFYIDYYFAYQSCTFLVFVLILVILFKFFIRFLSKSDSLFFSLAYFLLFISYQDNLAEVFYWHSGLFVYLFGCLGSILLFNNLHSFFDKDQKSKLILSVCLIILSAGCNEISMLINFLILFYFWFHATKKINKKILTYLILVAVCAMGIVVLAPGNKIRAHAVSSVVGVKMHNWNFAIDNSLYSVLESFVRWNGKFSFLFVLILLFLKLSAKKSNRKWTTFELVFSWGVFLLFFYSVYFSFYWSVGTRMEPRTESVMCFLFLLSISYLIIGTMKFFNFNFKSNLLLHFVTIMFIFSLTQQYNLKYARKDLSTGVAEKYHQLTLSRLSIMQANQGSNELKINKIKNDELPFSIHSKRTNFPNSLDDNGGSWLGWFQRKYKIKKIVLVD